jgi:hypothetical protein
VTTTLLADFEDLIAALVARDVRFLVVGAHALASHGVVRATGDLDIWVQPTADNARRVFAALADWGAPLQAHGIDVDDFARADTVYQVGLPPFRIDVLTSLSGLAFDRSWHNRMPGPHPHLAFFVLSLEDLVINKRATGRTKDLLDIELLREAGVLPDDEVPKP